MLGVDPTAERSEPSCRCRPGRPSCCTPTGSWSGGTARSTTGLATLAAHLKELAGSPLEELCDGLLRRMLRGIPQDDVALVAVRLRPIPTRDEAGTPAGNG